MLRKSYLSGLALIGISSAFLLLGCTSNPPNQVDNLKTPTKEILIFEGDASHAYVVLGTVEYTLEGTSIYDNHTDTSKAAREGLKKAAFTKYGEKVDAIINTKSSIGRSGGWGGAFIAAYGAKNGDVNIEGVAVSYNKIGTEEKSTEQPSTNKKKKKK